MAKRQPAVNKVKTIAKDSGINNFKGAKNTKLVDRSQVFGGQFKPQKGAAC